jgi:capsid assembly protease
MKYARILSAFYNAPLALMPEKIEAIRRFLHTKAAGDEIPPEEVAAIVATRRLRAQDRFDDAQDDPRAGPRHKSGALMAGRVAIVEVFGVLSQRLGMMEAMSGGVSCEEIGAQLDSLVDDKAVKSVLMSFDSPGGSVAGIIELGNKIRSLRDEKKIVGLADSMAASAGYWLYAQCGECNVTPGGMIGSIGVYTAHEDWSKFDDEMGVKTTLVSAGDYKVEANPYGPLSDEAKGELQKQVDHYYGEFVGAVAKGRGVTEARVKADFGKGRMVTAGDAVSRGMADRVATLDQVLRRLGAEPSSSGMAANVARARAKLAEVE